MAMYTKCKECNKEILYSDAVWMDEQSNIFHEFCTPRYYTPFNHQYRDAPKNTSSRLGNLRRSGRTTRMLREAHILAWKGNKVVVYVGTETLAQTMRQQLASGLNGPPGSIEIKSWLPNEFDWTSMRPVGTSSDTVVLVDHHVIESNLAKAFEMAHRFDR